ncbi:MAG TPA: hypothetical protein DEF18_06820 [Muricauda sp.]|nr:hypothetical protein [Allomuricauda sp.]HBU77798.1 hypothetical protein [Allomuricauda sp.]
MFLKGTELLGWDGYWEPLKMENLSHPMFGCSVLKVNCLYLRMGAQFYPASVVCFVQRFHVDNIF